LGLPRFGAAIGLAVWVLNKAAVALPGERGDGGEQAKQTHQCAKEIDVHSCSPVLVIFVVIQGEGHKLKWPQLPKPTLAVGFFYGNQISKLKAIRVQKYDGVSNRRGLASQP
jgi:hypothetical protein